jgi:hypothetical protein
MRSYTIFFCGGQSDVVCKLDSFRNSTADVFIPTPKMDASCASETFEILRAVIRLQNQNMKRKMRYVVRQFLLRKKQSLSTVLLVHMYLLTGDSVCLPPANIIVLMHITPDYKGTIITIPCNW